MLAGSRHAAIRNFMCSIIIVGLSLISPLAARTTRSTLQAAAINGQGDVAPVIIPSEAEPAVPVLVSYPALLPTGGQALSKAGQWCRHSSECGGRGLVCQCFYRLPKESGKYTQGTSTNWLAGCSVMYWMCIDRQQYGYTYYSLDYQPLLDTDWRPRNDYGVMDDTLFRWDGLHPDLVPLLDRFLADPEVQAYLDTRRMVVIFTSGYRHADNWSQHKGGRAIDMYLTPRTPPQPGTMRWLQPITPLRPRLFELGFLYTIAWDTPHYYLPELPAPPDGSDNFPTQSLN